MLNTQINATVDSVETPVADVIFSSYAHIGVGSSDSGVITDETTMSIYFDSISLVDDVKYIGFSYQLVIEEYIPNVNTESIATQTGTETTTATGEATTLNNFVKLSSRYGETSRTTTPSFTGMETVENLIVVIPNSVTEIITPDGKSRVFFNFTKLIGVSIPNSITSISSHSFVWTKISSIIINLKKKKL